MKDMRVVTLLTVWTIAAVGQVVLSFLLYAEPGNDTVRNVGWGVLCLSAVFGWLPIYYLKKWGGVPEQKSYVHTTVLVDRGVYAVVRHPQFLAGILMGVALPLIAQHWLVAVLGAIAIVTYYISAFEDEKSTTARFGEDYERYRESVPRFNFILGLVRVLRRRSSR
ncbi:MAG: isoprenylcysteine carboxylmethyltransferase family protein [Dehalococcoidia bacterium]|nr:isoprenylcysteine carboxylmethyltransferase family protein [Dehalococcoidia bacterium]